ncbi:MAG TPA: permease-like cell division protein FtsX [Dissulfurispiraceae bacterium]|nr:permease-like cell division protein FtsX [Dissulfurispiraceae bacterium]
MDRFSYSSRTAINSLRREKWINLLSSLTVAASLLVSAMVVLTIYNLDSYIRLLPERFTMVAYLKDGVSTEDVQKLAAVLKSKEYVSSVRYISKEQALNDMKRTLKDVSNILEGIDENPLSSAIEVKLKKESVSALSVTRISEDLKKMPGIEDVYYEAKIAETVYLLKTSIENLSIIILCIIGFVVLFVIASTVKILLYRRKAEIEIIKLLGATGGFIRTPFLIEGGVIGFLGGLFATAGLAIFYYMLTTSFSAFMPVLRTMVLPWQIIVLLPVAGIVMGVMGSFISVGRLRL